MSLASPLVRPVFRRAWMSAGHLLHKGGRPAIAIACAIFALHLTGCYNLVEASRSAVPVGASISVGVTDQGRLDLVESVGPGVERLTGEVVEQTDSSLVLVVRSVTLSDLPVPVRWQGEHVEIPNRAMRDVRERRFSQSRTWIAVSVVTVAAIAASLITIRGFGGDERPERPAPGPGDDV
jgi:hypothetical protein